MIDLFLKLTGEVSMIDFFTKFIINLIYISLIYLLFFSRNRVISDLTSKFCGACNNVMNYSRINILLFFSSILIVIFTYLNGIIGFKWDEHYIALGGYYISHGLKPHIDFIIPNGALIYYLQSIGNFIFNDIMLAYPFSASLIEVIFFIFMIKLIMKRIHLTYLEFTLLLCILLFTFFSLAGALWYNQLATLFLTISILIISHKFISNNSLRAGDIFIISVLIFCSIITKPDVGLLHFTLLLLIFIFYFKPKRNTFYLFFLVTFFIILYFLYYKIFYNINIFEQINYGQDGFIKRFHFSLRFLLGIIKALIWRLSSISTRTIFLLFICIFFMEKLYLQRRYFFFLLIQSFLYLSSAIVLKTSGRGAGFINSHYIMAMFINLLYFMKYIRCKWQCESIIIVLLLIFFFVVRYVTDFIPSYQLYKNSNITYFTSRDTNLIIDKVYNLSEELSKSLNRKVLLYAKPKYIFLNNNISLNASTQYLWDHYGVTINDRQLHQHTIYFLNHLPDIFVVDEPDPRYTRINNYTITSLDDNFGRDKSIIGKVLKEKYTLYFKGYLDLVNRNPYVIKIYKRRQ